MLETLAEAPTDWDSDGDALLLAVKLALAVLLAVKLAVALLDSDEVAEIEELAVCTVRMSIRRSQER